MNMKKWIIGEINKKDEEGYNDDDDHYVDVKDE